MAIFRQVQMTFWSDEKVLDEFTPEDKYFYLYLFTNPQTNLAGCYELGWTSTTGQTGYTKETILRLLERFETVHGVIKYCKETKEVMLLNWSKYNWTNSSKLDKPLLEQIEKIKCMEFRTALIEMYNNRDNVSIPYEYPIDTTVTVTDTTTDSIKDIIDYLNEKTGSKYTYRNKSYNKHITGRLNDGFTVDDFKAVIDKKCFEWLDSDMEQYLTPDTLFAPSKFEKYLNQQNVRRKNNGGTSSQAISLLDALADA